MVSSCALMRIRPWRQCCSHSRLRCVYLDSHVYGFALGVCYAPSAKGNYWDTAAAIS
ncbi:hypothetical protein ABIA39_008918 [Nocardia sp. GAS34]